MAKVELNPLIKSLHGRAGNIVFYNRYGKTYARLFVVPCNPDTEAQRKIRHAFGDAVKTWQSMSCEQKCRYNRKARYLNMSGYNLFISCYMKSRTIAGGRDNFYSSFLQLRFNDLYETGALSSLIQMPYSMQILQPP